MQIDPENLELAEELRQVIGTFVRRVRSGTSTPSTAQSETLDHLLRQGPSTTAELARLRGVRHQSMRLVLAELEAARLVERLPDPKDGRSRQMIITPEGRSLVASSRRARAEWIARELQDSLSPREREALESAIEILRRIGTASSVGR